MKENLFGKTLDELISVTREEGLPGYAARQMTDWLYVKGVKDIGEMTNLSKKTRLSLDKRYSITHFPPSEEFISTDGTKKYLFPTFSDKFIESAYLPDEKRATLCISSQVGCRMGCRFCMTGKQGFQGNLSVAGILNQLFSLPEKEKITNIVFMGMGEPLDNTDNVLRAIEIMTSSWGLAMSPRRITMSTIGIKDEIERFIEETDVHIAVSLHSPFSDERHTLIPAEKANPVTDIIRLLANYDWRHQRRISFEYIVFRDLNDTPAHINALVKLLSGIHCRLNLIRYHDTGSGYSSPEDDKILEMRNSLTSKGVYTTIRASRGEDIMAACGMLSTSRYYDQD